MLIVYPYKQIHSGKHTKWSISITAEGMVLVEHYFKGRRKAQEVFFNQKSIMASELPKNVRETARGASQDAKGLGLGG